MWNIAVGSKGNQFTGSPWSLPRYAAGISGLCGIFGERAVQRKYRGIGAALVAFGVQLSVDAGYGGMMYLKAKTPEIRERYIRDFGAIPFSRREPFFCF